MLARPLKPPAVAITKNTFIRAVAVLIGGSAIAHGITAVALPVLTRLYTPADFSVLAVFSGILSVVSVAACLRFDIAVSIPEHDVDAVNLLALAVLCAGLFAAAALLVVILAPAWVTGILKQPRIEPYLVMLPVGIFLAGAYSALQMWFVRNRQFALIARSRVAQSAASAGTQVGLGALAITPIGLLVGFVMNTGVACIGLGYRFWRDKRSRGAQVAASWTGMTAMAKAYQRYPKFSTFEALFNSAAIQVPIIIIAALASGPEAGYLALAMAVMQAPMALFGTAIGQVFVSKAPAEFRAGRLGSFTAEVFGGLLKAGAGPIIAAGILAPMAFPLIFGVTWERAGWLVAWMTPWFVFQFLSSPLSMVLHVVGQQRTALLLQLAGLLVRVSTVVLAYAWSPQQLSEAYALSGCAFYGGYVALVLSVAGVGWIQVVRALRRAFLACTFCATVAASLCVVIQKYA